MCPALCNPMDCSPPGSFVHGIFQARILEWVAFPSPGDLPDPGIKLGSPALQADSLPSESWEKPLNDVTSNLFTHSSVLARDGGAWWAAVYGVAQSRTRLKRLSSSSNLFWNLLLMECSPPGSSVNGIFQARILECIVISYSRGSFPPRDQTPCLLHWQADSLPLHHLGSHVEF